MIHLVLIGDLIASRHITDRAATQTLLAAALKRLNRTSRPSLTSPYTLTLGDEFQAVFHRADTVFQDIVSLMHQLEPVQIRFSLALGEITTALNHRQALAMDGPAFYRARAGIDHLKGSGDLLAVSGLPAPCQELTTGSLRLVGHVMEKWRPNRLAILQRLMAEEPVKDIAKALQISEPAVYKNITMGNLDAVMQLLTAVSTNLNAELIHEDQNKLSADEASS